MKQHNFKNFNFQKLHSIQNIEPRQKTGVVQNIICGRCCYINQAKNNFCTNCGYPQKDAGALMIYQLRTKHRTELLKKSEDAVKVARIILFLLGSIFLTGIGFLFSSYYNRFTLAIVFILLSVLFFSLAKWSMSKPFSALISGFVMVLCFSTITVFGEVVSAFTTVGGVYTIALSMLLIYFLLRGVQGAYKAGLINDEMMIY